MGHERASSIPLLRLLHLNDSPFCVCVTCTTSKTPASGCFVRAILPPSLATPPLCPVYPRSTEDRTETLLALLSRYHVLGETVTGEAGSEDGKHTAAAPVKDETRQVQKEKQETNNRKQANEVDLNEIVDKNEIKDDQDTGMHEPRSEGDAAAGLDDGDGDGEGDDRTAERGSRHRGEGKAAVGLHFSSRGRKECEEAFMELMLDERNR